MHNDLLRGGFRIIARETNSKTNNTGVVQYESNSVNPRRRQGNLGTLIIYHDKYILDRYDDNKELKRDIYQQSGLQDKLHELEHNFTILGDLHPVAPPIERWLTLNGYLFRRIYFCEHPIGAWISTEPIVDIFMGLIGWIVASKDKAKEFFGVEDISQEIEEQILDRLEFEVSEYNAYLRDEVIEYMITSPTGDLLRRRRGYIYPDEAKADMLADLEVIQQMNKQICPHCGKEITYVEAFYGTVRYPDIHDMTITIPENYLIDCMEEDLEFGFMKIQCPSCEQSLDEHVRVTVESE